jgi:outer membrane lipoprotein-sorting protein
MRVSIVLVAAVLVACATAAWAVCEGTDACLRAIEESQRTTRALTARFEQTKHLSLLTEPLVSRGRFAFKAPDQVLWQIDEPKVTVRIDQHGVHLPDLPNAEAEVAALAPFSEMMRELSGLFTGSLTTVQKSFDVTAAGDAAAIRVHLVPRSEQWRRMFRSLELEFAAPDLVMHTIHIDEALGDSLEIVFSEVHRNDDVANAVFGAAPAGHD